MSESGLTYPLAILKAILAQKLDGEQQIKPPRLVFDADRERLRLANPRLSTMNVRRFPKRTK